MKRGVALLLAFLTVFGLAPAGTAFAQGAGRPASPPSGGVTLSQEPPAAPAPSPQPQQPPGSSADKRPTLVPDPGDPLDVKEVTLPGRAAAVISGASTWEDGFDALKSGIRKLEEELRRAGLRAAGRPVTVFTETDDMSFTYDLMMPVDERAAQGRANLTPEIRFGRTPQGKAYHFVHKGPYDEIDSTYETITAYLDSKGILPQDAFIEEYVTDLTDSADDKLEINIFVQPR
jgi:effector-binding domain-containing protein